MKLFNSIGHLFAWILHVGLPKASVAVSDVASAVNSPLAGYIAQLLGSKAESVQRGMQAIAGDVLKSFGDAAQTISADGLNVKFDAATVDDIRQLYRDVVGLFGSTAPAKAN